MGTEAVFYGSKLRGVKWIRGDEFAELAELDQFRIHQFHELDGPAEDSDQFFDADHRYGDGGRSAGAHAGPGCVLRS